MKIYYSSLHGLWLIPIVLTASPAAVAQAIVDAKTSTSQVTDAQASVPAVTYQSVFKETSLGVEKDTDNWRKANSEVGKFLRGHVDILKWEEQESAKTMKEPMAAPGSQQKPAMAPEGAAPAKPATTKPIAAPAHKH